MRETSEKLQEKNHCGAVKWETRPRDKFQRFFRREPGKERAVMGQVRAPPEMAYILRKKTADKFNVARQYSYNYFKFKFKHYPLPIKRESRRKD